MLRFLLHDRTPALGAFGLGHRQPQRLQILKQTCSELCGRQEAVPVPSQPLVGAQGRDSRFFPLVEKTQLAPPSTFLSVDELQGVGFVAVLNGSDWLLDIAI